MNKLLWENLISLISKHIGFHIKVKDYHTLEVKIAERIKILKLVSIGEYYNLLKDSIEPDSSNISPQNLYKGSQEWNTLAKIITNGESFFFRDRGQFNLLQETIIPQLLAKKREASDFNLKIWSSGCSTGQEPYSLAILLDQIITDISQWNITVIGTDINQDFLNKARTGVYQDWSFRLTDGAFKKNYFTFQKNGWQINHKIQRMVRFYYDNIVQEQVLPIPCHEIDLILCRNVFIYFEKHSVAKGINKFYSALNSGGYLMTGHAELQGIALNGFKILSFPESIIYQKTDKENIDNGVASVQSYINIESIEQDSTANNFLKYLHLESSDIFFDNWDDTSSNILNKKNLEKINILPAKSQNKPNSLDNKQELATKNLVSNLETLLESGQYDKVIEQGKNITEPQTNHHLIYHLMAQAYANQNNLEQAELYCKKVLDIDSIFVPTLYLSAQIAESQDDLKKTKEILKRIIYLEPSSIMAYLELGAVYTKEHDFTRASKMYQTAYEILQDFPLDKTFDYQGIVTVRELINYVERKISNTI